MTTFELLTVTPGGDVASYEISYIKAPTIDDLIKKLGLPVVVKSTHFTMLRDGFKRIVVSNAQIELFGGIENE